MEPTQIKEGNVKHGGIADSPKGPRPIAVPRSQNVNNKLLRCLVNCDEILHKRDAPTDKEIAWINEEVLAQIKKHTRRKYIIQITNLRKNELYSSDEPLEKRDVHYYEVFLQPES